jgi:hypothetical protein
LSRRLPALRFGKAGGQEGLIGDWLSSPAFAITDGQHAVEIG